MKHLESTLARSFATAKDLEVWKDYFFKLGFSQDKDNLFSATFNDVFHVFEILPQGRFFMIQHKRFLVEGGE